MSKLTMKYFMLCPYRKTPVGAASRVAIEAYAKNIQNHDPQLTKELTQWMKSIRTEDEMSINTPEEIFIYLPTHSFSYLIDTIKYYGNTFTYFGGTLWSQLTKSIADKLSKWDPYHSTFMLITLTTKELSFLSSVINLERKYAQKNRNQWIDLYSVINKKAMEYGITEEKYE